MGFTGDPWRRAHQASGIPSVGDFESQEFHPDRFVTEEEDPAFRALTDRDAYWGAKIVASLSDPQIAAAVEAAGVGLPPEVDVPTAPPEATITVHLGNLEPSSTSAPERVEWIGRDHEDDPAPGS